MPRVGIRRFTLFSVCLLGVWAEGALIDSRRFVAEHIIIAVSLKSHVIG